MEKQRGFFSVFEDGMQGILELGGGERVEDGEKRNEIGMGTSEELDEL